MPWNECSSRGDSNTTDGLLYFNIHDHPSINLSICSFIPIPMNIFNQASDSATNPSIHPSIHPFTCSSTLSSSIHHPHLPPHTHGLIHASVRSSEDPGCVSVFALWYSECQAFALLRLIISWLQDLLMDAAPLSVSSSLISVQRPERELCSFNEENFPGGSSVDFPLRLLGQNCITWIFLNNPLARENISS